MKAYLRHLVSFGLFASFTGSVFASGYKIEMQSPAVLADGGDAAVIDDASTNWYNSAGLVYLPNQMVFSGVEVYAPTTFSGNVVAPTMLPPPVPQVPFMATSQTSSSHPRAFLPSIHGSHPLNEHFAIGLSVVPAWGLKEDYGIDDFTRYNLVRIYTKTLDIAPSLAWRPTTHWSVGVGPDFHYFAVQSRLKSRTEPLTVNDSLNRYTADNWGYGAHAGLMYKINEATRVGVNYRSKILMDMDGYSYFGLDGVGVYQTSNFKLRIPLPPVTTLSAYRDVTNNWAMMGTISYEQWGIVKNYRAQNFQGPGVIVPVIYQPQHMHNTFDFALGTHYKVTDRFMVRGAFRYLETPTNGTYRGITFPDGDKYGLNIGCHYQLTKKVGMDVIYAHVITKKVNINDVNPATGATATGHSVTSVDLGGAQLVWDL